MTTTSEENGDRPAADQPVANQPVADHPAADHPVAEALNTGLITLEDIDDIARGAAVLGSGGGGDPHIGGLLAKHAIATHGPVSLVSVDSLTDDDLVLPVAIMGAPTVIVEKPPAGTEFAKAFELVASRMGRPVTHVGCLEAGGLNSMTPIVTAAQTGLPLIDGDGMGRAFPELQMVLFTLDGIPASPMAMADDKGNTILLDTVSNQWTERLARPATVEMGCSASIALYPMSGRQAAATMVPATITLARSIGRTLRQARAAHLDPSDVLAESQGGKVLLRGKVTDVSRTTVAGFARGTATIEGVATGAGSALTLHFQNEHLLALGSDGAVLASTPDLICVLDVDTGEPVTTEAMRYGFRVAVVALPCDPRWRSTEGLALVGPRYFGYDLDHAPF